MLLDIPFVEGSIEQETDAETGDWFQWWELPPETILWYAPLLSSSETAGSRLSGKEHDATRPNLFDPNC